MRTASEEQNMQPFYVQNSDVLQNGGSDRLVYRPQEATTWLRVNTATTETLVGQHHVSTCTQLASLSVLNALTTLQIVWAVTQHTGIINAIVTLKM
jgi:hypothetical protein